MRTRLAALRLAFAWPRANAKRLFAIVFLLALATTACADRTNEQILANADAAFRLGVENQLKILIARKHFASATDGYRDLHQRGVRSPALYLNLGNAATLADRWPEAIWAYHQGLKLDPNDQRLREQLAFVRGKVIYPPAGQGRPEPDPWPPWLYRPTEVEYAIFAAIAYALACLLGTLAWMRGSLRFAVIACLILALALAAAFGLWRLYEQAGADRDTPLVVLRENTPFHRGNGPSYPQHPVLPILPRGMEVRQQHRRGSWLQIRLTTGEIGWISASSALIVEPLQ